MVARYVVAPLIEQIYRKRGEGWGGELSLINSAFDVMDQKIIW